MQNKIDKFMEYINESKNIVFFGGAGVSTESGIPDFRSKDGLYNQKDVQFEKYTPEYLLDRECLYHNPKVFFEYYRQKFDTRNIEPNITHKTLAKMEKMGKLSAIVTQNIDELHQKAGSKNVYEIHGNALRTYCTKCGKEYEKGSIFDKKEKIPRCECGGMLRPDITLYGENLPKDASNNAFAAICAADMLIIGGTSLRVWPAASYVNYFSGNHLVIINKERLDGMHLNDEDLIFEAGLGEIFTQIDKRL